MDRFDATVGSAEGKLWEKRWAENHAREMGLLWKKYCILNEDIYAKIKKEIENREISGEKPPSDAESWKRLFQELELKLMKTQHGEWEEIVETRPPLPRYPTKAQRKKILDDWRRKNRLLINDGLACWKYKWDESVVVTGYKLRSNPKIYKAVFQHHREEYYFELRKEVKLFGRFIAADFRQTLYYKTLMDIPELKIIPRFIIMKIANLTFDPITYSYLSS